MEHLIANSEPVLSVTFNVKLTYLPKY